jgi:MFS family permease
VTNTSPDSTPPSLSETDAPHKLGRNVYALGAVSFFTDVATEMIYPLLPVFLTSVLGASAGFVGVIEGAAESTAALLKLASGWWSDRVSRRKPLVVVGYVIASVVRPLIALAQTASVVLAIRVSDRIGKGLRSSARDALIAESVHPSIRGRAFGFHSAADNAGAFVGPLIAFAVLTWWSVSLRTVFWLSAIPGALAIITVIAGPRDVRRARDAAKKEASAPDLAGHMGKRFWVFLGVIIVFTLGNSTDAFLLLRAAQLGVPVALAPILWAVLNFVKTVFNVPGGAFSDRAGRKPALFIGWAVYAIVYLLFGLATKSWQAWALFAAYGLYFGFTEGTERALVADMVPQERRGAAFGWYYVAIGIGALPASLLFGVVWDRAGSPTAFTMGAILAALSAIGLLFVTPRRAR